jgi:hypothetical protein
VSIPVPEAGGVRAVVSDVDASAEEFSFMLYMFYHFLRLINGVALNRANRFDFALHLQLEL